MPKSEFNKRMTLMNPFEYRHGIQFLISRKKLLGKSFMFATIDKTALSVYNRKHKR